MILLYTRRLSALELLKLLRQNGYHFLLIRFNSGFFYAADRGPPCRLATKIFASVILSEAVS